MARRLLPEGIEGQAAQSEQPSSSEGRCPKSLISTGLDKGVTGVIHHSLSLKLKHDKPRTFYFTIYHSLLRILQ